MDFLILAAEAGGVDLGWQQLLLGYGPLGVFAVLVGIDKIGNNSERNRLRAQLEGKDAHIQELHAKIESDVVPALIKSVQSQQEGAKTLADAVDVIRQYTDPPLRQGSARTRREE